MDIVAELDRWLRGWGKDEDVRPLMERARDEIAALREKRADIRRVVLEEAALACDAAVEADPLYAVYYKACAAAIRALK